MKFWKSWVIANKDFKIFLKKKRILYALIILPLFLSIGLPFVVRYIINNADSASMTEIVVLLNAFSFFYIILAYILPSTLAAYSILGEKIEQSLEPLLATPTTDGELLFGKTIASFLPCIAMIYLGAMIFMVLSDVVTYNKFGYLFFPNFSMAIILLLAVPLAAFLSIQLNVIISSKVSDIRTANQLSIIMFLPFILLYVLLETNIVSLNILNLLGIFAILFVADLLMFYLSKSIFNRDSILTKWK